MRNVSGQPMRLLGLPLKVGELDKSLAPFVTRVIGNNCHRHARSRLKIRLFVRLNEDAMLKTLRFWYTTWTDSACDPLP